MSMHHTHDAIRKHIPAPGDVLVTSQSKPILTLLGASRPAPCACNQVTAQNSLPPDSRARCDSAHDL